MFLLDGGVWFMSGRREVHTFVPPPDECLVKVCIQYHREHGVEPFILVLEQAGNSVYDVTSSTP